MSVRLVVADWRVSCRALVAPPSACAAAQRPGAGGPQSPRARRLAMVAAAVRSLRVLLLAVAVASRRA